MDGSGMIKIGAIVQVRMSSQRLPGKVLYEVYGKPLLQYILESIEHCSAINKVIIATSLEKSDDPVEEFCNKHHTPCYRGSLNDVASRFREISEKERWDAFVRINGDSPLIDYHLIDKGTNLYRDGHFDLVTNVFPRTHPSGQSVEIVRSSTFKKVYHRMNDSGDFEHVTKFFYHNPKEFKIFNFTSSIDCSSIHLSVDTQEDMQMFSKIIGKMVRPHWDYTLEDVLKINRELCMN